MLMELKIFEFVESDKGLVWNEVQEDRSEQEGSEEFKNLFTLMGTRDYGGNFLL